MKLLLILSFAALAVANPNTSRGFASLVSMLQDDVSIDMEEVLASEDLYLQRLSHKDEVFYSEVELLVGAEEEELADDLEDDDGTEDSSEPDISDLPEELDLRDKGIMHRAIYQGGCSSCGWVSGTQTLEARIALVSENYIPYSIQNFMNCAGRPCIGAQPYTVNTQARKSGVIISEDEIPYTKKQCLKESKKGKEACYAKCGAKNPGEFTNALDEQFVVIAGTRAVRSEAQLMAALQEGPLTTCFQRKKRLPGERCRAGCSHANSIIGYTKDDFIVQESYGKHWGHFKDGSWVTPKGSACVQALIKKAYYPKIFYDYDRANAYYTQIEVGVDEKELKFVDKSVYGIPVINTKNWGTAKNKCAFLGSACKGVVAHSSGVFELVSDFGAGSSGGQAAFKKFQMVVYLKHEETGKYIGIKNSKNGPKLQSVEKMNAAAFFTSYARFISFDYPTYHIVENTLERITGGIRDIDVMKAWHLNNCNIYNAASGNSFDLVSEEDGKTSLGAGKFDKTSSSQRFNIGISGKWLLTSSKLGYALANRKTKGISERYFTDDEKSSAVRFRWQARQIMNKSGITIGPDIKLTGKDFDFKDTQNAMTPTDCTISKLIPMPGVADHLALEDGKLVMTSDTESGWTFEYADL